MSNWDHNSTSDASYDPSTSNGKLDKEELPLANIEGRTRDWLSRTSATHRKFKTVLVEIKLEVVLQPGRILMKTIDPVLAGLRSFAVEEGGISQRFLGQEVMENGEEARATEMHAEVPSLLHCGVARESLSFV